MAFSETNKNIHVVAANDPTKLCLFAGAPSVLADNSTSTCIFVQLQDSSGKPARALQDITVGLSSSLTIIGTVDSSIVIPKGDTFASANFTSTFNPGTTVISASATGFETVLSTLTTVGPIPSTLSICGFPAVLPADGNSYAAIMVQLQDATGFPARAPQGGVKVDLTCSNTTIGTVSQFVTILEGETYSIANFTTTTIAETEGKIELANITAMSQGYASNQFMIKTTPVASNPTILKIFTGPSKVLADQSSYKQVAVQLQNASGYAAKKQSGNIQVNIASNDSSICQVDPVTIIAGQNYVLTTLNTTYKAGSANITAAANDFPITNQTISTSGFVATKLIIYSIPASLPSDGTIYQTIQVQLQDAQGRPAKNTGLDASVKLFSSQPTVATVSSAVAIPFGKSTATGNLTLSYTPGNTTITAQASGYSTGQATVITYLIDSNIISASPATNGIIAPNGTVSVILGGSQRFNLTANKGYHISDIIVDNISQGAAASYIFANVTGPHMIVADFAINTFNIEVNQSANGEIDPGTTTVDYGDTPEFNITPDEGYYISNITANNATVPITSNSGQQYQFSPVTSNGSLTATFTIRTITIQVTQTGNGTIAPGTTTIDYNGSQTFRITPKAGFHVAEVLVNGTSAGPVSSYNAHNIKGATTISAIFAPDIAPTPTATPSPTPSSTPTPQPKNSTISKAAMEDGQIVNLLINGNITSQQMTNVTIAKNMSSTITTLSFQLTGEDGTTGYANITIPKSAVGQGAIPTIYIDSSQVEGQGFSQDINNYYVWFSTHFSNHIVSIVFSSPVSNSQFLSQKMIYAIGTILTISVVSALFLLRKRLDLRAKLENLKIF
jgi:hypothetical protein